MLVEQAAEAFLLLARRAAATTAPVLARAARALDSAAMIGRAAARIGRFAGLLAARACARAAAVLPGPHRADGGRRSAVDDLPALGGLAPAAREPARCAAGSQQWIDYPAISPTPEARRDRLRGRRLHRAQRRRVGRAREGLGTNERAEASPSRPTSARSGRPSAARRPARARRRARRRSSAARPSPSSWRRTCSSSGERNLAAQGPGARARLGARGDARQAAHPRDLPQQRRVGRRRVRRRGRGAPLLPRRRGALSARSRRRSWR